ncbi:MAG: metallophosphoesterase [Candidatus Thorarchaeota archaeon]
MRIAAVSDLHILPDGSDELLLKKIRERVEEIDPDVFVIAGDISDRLNVLSNTLAQLYIDGCINLFVAGNHDIWFEDGGGPGSLEKYSKVIGEECMKNGFSHLPDAPVILESYAFVGSIGWYDYSFRREDLDIPLKNYEQKEYRGAIWYDLLRLDWGFNDTEVTELFNKKIKYDLSTLSGDCKHVIFVSHHLPFSELTVFKNRLPWDFYSAFMGAVSTGQIIIADGRVRLSISGHSHIRSMISKDGFTAITVPLGYGRPDSKQLDAFVRDIVAVIDLDESDIQVHDFVSGDLSAGLPFYHQERNSTH